MCKSVNIFVFRSYQCCPGAADCWRIARRLDAGWRISALKCAGGKLVGLRSLGGGGGGLGGEECVLTELNQLLTSTGEGRVVYLGCRRSRSGVCCGFWIYKILRSIVGVAKYHWCRNRCHVEQCRAWRSRWPLWCVWDVVYIYWQCGYRLIAQTYIATPGLPFRKDGQSLTRLSRKQNTMAIGICQ